MSKIIQASDIFCTFNKQQLFKGLSLSIHRGDRIALTGKSGSGKSTLLHILSGLTANYQGTVTYKNIDYRQMEPARLSKLRQHELGFIYQQSYWLGDYTVLENVSMPLRIQNKSTHEANQMAHQQLCHFNLNHKAHEPCHILSGGERQRMCLARAMIIRPEVLFADEPTGQLDAENAHLVMKQLTECTDDTTLIIATHDKDISQYCYTHIEL
ncbi:MAG: ATP-binding cassette domain-containing protein [Pseudomonadota bacterium]|nr:ATP-binding cassette domain-containing protein [Pseudomonadota bacterium]